MRTKEIKLPTTRKEQISYFVLHETPTLFAINLLAFIFLLPFLANIFVGLLSLSNLVAKNAPRGDMFNVLLVVGLINIPTLIIAGFGDMGLYNCFKELSLETSNDKTKLIYVGFSLPNSMDSSFLKNGVYKADETDHVLLTMYEIFNEVNNKGFYFAEQVDILLHYLLNLFKRVRSKKEEKPYEMQAIKDYIDKNCYKNLNAKMLADKFNYNYDYFRKKFMKNYHISINDYILNEQVNYATNLLRTTDLKISEIAKRSGFSSTSHFINCFKKRYNVTPKKYIY